MIKKGAEGTFSQSLSFSSMIRNCSTLVLERSENLLKNDLNPPKQPSSKIDLMGSAAGQWRFRQKPTIPLVLAQPHNPMGITTVSRSDTPKC
jgi:hypothetical protein